jgi:hypothetical protein
MIHSPKLNDPDLDLVGSSSALDEWPRCWRLRYAPGRKVGAYSAAQVSSCPRQCFRSQIIIADHPIHLDLARGLWGLDNSKSELLIDDSEKKKNRGFDVLGVMLTSARVG